MRLVQALALIIFTTTVHAQKFTWFGTTHIHIKDDDTNIMFDPFITHPSIWDLLFRRKVKSDEKLIDKWLKKANLNQVDAVFINHAHFDHIMDFHIILKKFGAIGFGSQSSINYALGQGISKGTLRPLKDKSTVQVEDYVVTAVQGKHPPHFLGHTFMDGVIEKPFALPDTAWKMKKGDDLVYYLKNDKGNIFFHPFANKSPTYKNYKQFPAKILFLGVSKRTSTKDQIEQIVKPIGAKIVIPIHQDNFFYQLREDPPDLPISNMDEWYETFKKLAPEVKVIKPQVAKWIDLSKI
jgi:L-ascorbate metabolism protein UlaG (beta-lactamase superfamily)